MISFSCLEYCVDCDIQGCLQCNTGFDLLNDKTCSCPGGKYIDANSECKPCSVNNCLDCKIND